MINYSFWHLNVLLSISLYLCFSTNLYGGNKLEFPYSRVCFLSDTLKNKVVDIQEVVISAQITPKKTDNAVQNIQLINRQRIDALGSNTLQQLLIQQFNMRLTQDNILGSAVSLQGLSGQNVKVLVDGIPIIGRLNGNIDVSQINLNTIDKIEIIEGPLSVNFGSDALAGTINLISREPQNNESEINCYYETVGHYNFDVIQSLNLKPHIFSFSFGRNYFDGWSMGEKINFIPVKNVADESRYDEWKPKEQYFFKGLHSFKKNELKLKSQYNSFYEKIVNKGLPRAPLYNTAFDDFYQTWRKSFSSFLTYNINKSNTDIQISHTSYKRIKNTYFKDLVDLSEVISNNSSSHDTSSFINSLIKGSLKLPSKNQLEREIGFDFNRETAKGNRIEHNKQVISDYALFSNIEWTPYSNFVVRPGLRLAYNTNYNAPLIPSIHLRYKFRNINFRTSYAKGYRAPSLKEQFFNFVDINHNIIGNKELNAETSKNFQLSLNYDKVFSTKHMFKLQTNIFFNQITELITLASVEDLVYKYINLGEYKTKGITATCALKISYFDINSSFSYLGRFNQFSEANHTDPYIYTLDYSSTISHFFAKQNFRLSLFFKHTGDLPSYMLDEDGNILNSFIEGYQILDLTFSKKLMKSISLIFGCKNILNVQKTDAINITSGAHQTSQNSISVAYGRTFFTSLKWKIK